MSFVFFKLFRANTVLCHTAPVKAGLGHVSTYLLFTMRTHGLYFVRPDLDLASTFTFYDLRKWFLYPFRARAPVKKSHYFISPLIPIITFFKGMSLPKSLNASFTISARPKQHGTSI